MKLITPPAEPVSVAMLRDHARIDAAESDALLGVYLAAARATAEQQCQRAFLPQTWEFVLDAFAESMAVPFGPLRSVVSIEYADAAGALRPLDLSTVYVDPYYFPGYILTEPGGRWPASAAVANAVRIRYEAGTWDTADEVPAELKNWILIRAATAYAHREAVAQTGGLSPLFYVDSLLDGWRTYT